MNKLSHILLSGMLLVVSSLPAIADQDSGISVTQIAPAESAGGIVAPSGLTGLGGISSTQLGIAGLVLVGAFAMGGGSGGSSSATGTTGTSN